MQRRDLRNHRRGRFDIIVSILEAAKNYGATRNKIISKAKVNFAQANEYLGELEKSKFVIRNEMPMNRPVIWKTTDSGLRFIEAVRACHLLVDKFN